MRRMYSKNQIEEIANEVSAGVTAELVEGGELENAKPIYCHPISISNDASGTSLECRLELLILDNNESAYTKDALKSKLEDLMDEGALIMVVGYFKYESVVYGTYMIQKGASEYRLYGYSTSGRASVNLDNIIDENAVVEDGVNKIN